MNLFLNSTVAGQYDKYYETTQGIAADNIEKQIIARLIKNISAGSLLELGCGTGHWTKFFSQQGFQVTATDISEEMLKIAHSKNIKNATFQKADAAELPFPDQSFSLIASITMLEFVDDVESVLNEINRLLKSGGCLVLGYLNAESKLGENKNNDKVFRDAYFFSPEKIRQMLLKFGEPKTDSGVYYSSTFELLDGTDKQNTVQPAFIGAIVQKK